MLDQGGVLQIKDDHLLFAPRALERAMGAADVEIPFGGVKMVEVTGTLTEFLIVRTLEKPHKFVGGDLYKIRDIINSAHQVYLQKSPRPAAVPAPAPSASAPAETKVRT